MRFERIISEMNTEAALPSDDWAIPVGGASLCAPSPLSPSSSCSPVQEQRLFLSDLINGIRLSDSVLVFLAFIQVHSVES